MDNWTYEDWLRWQKQCVREDVREKKDQEVKKIAASIEKDIRKAKVS